MQAFYSAPHLRPPMALQYAVWTMASLGHEKYSTYHDVFHRRCRHYLEEDELRVGPQKLISGPCSLTQSSLLHFILGSLLF